MIPCCWACRRIASDLRAYSTCLTSSARQREQSDGSYVRRSNASLSGADQARAAAVLGTLDGSDEFYQETPARVTLASSAK
jgi:hypothetical protein